MRALIIIGDGPIFKLAIAIAAKTLPEGATRVVDMRPDEIATASLESLKSEAKGADAFVAIGMQALGYARFDLWAKVRFSGLRCTSLVHPAAHVDETATIADNCLVGPFAFVGPHARLERGSILLTHSSVEAEARVGAFSWLDNGASVGAGAQIGAHVSLGPGVHIAPGVLIGDDCDIAVEGTYRSDMAGRTFIDPLFDSPVRIHAPT